MEPICPCQRSDTYAHATLKSPVEHSVSPQQEVVLMPCCRLSMCAHHVSMLQGSFLMLPARAAARFEDIHSQLVPYFLTIGSFAYEHGTSTIRPLAKHDSWLNKVRTTRMLILQCVHEDRQAALCSSI